MDCPVKPGNDTRRINLIVKCLRLAHSQFSRRIHPERPRYAIDEASSGPNHPGVARDLNNLAGLLQATNRLSEAEPMYRRVLAILVQFARATGHQHPKFELVLGNYVQALHELGRPKAEIEATLKSIWEDAREPPP